MIKEFCAENFTKIKEVIAGGATRVELCDNLAEGGTTPSYGVIKQTLAYTKPRQVPVMVMIRARGGDFVYDQTEFDIMKTDLACAKKLGAEGFVFGCLDPDGRINRSQTQELIEASGTRETVFHMAFDEIPREYLFEELEWLIAAGITRILTHGGVGGTVRDHRAPLQEVLTYIDGRIEVVIGGGVTHANYKAIVNTFGVDQVHGTQIIRLK